MIDDWRIRIAEFERLNPKDESRVIAYRTAEPEPPLAPPMSVSEYLGLSATDWCWIATFIICAPFILFWIISDPFTALGTMVVGGIAAKFGILPALLLIALLGRGR
jgi:hypothetical protein